MKAIIYAANAHGQQTRKGKLRKPYIVHPVEVAQILGECNPEQDKALLDDYVSQETLQVIGVLHDVLEDTGVTSEELSITFGPQTMKQVEWLTDNRNIARAQRHQHFVQDRVRMMPAACRYVKLADMISNLRSIVTDTPLEWDIDRIDEYLERLDERFDALAVFVRNDVLRSSFFSAMRNARRHAKKLRAEEVGDE